LKTPVYIELHTRPSRWRKFAVLSITAGISASVLWVGAYAAQVQSTAAAVGIGLLSLLVGVISAVSSREKPVLFVLMSDGGLRIGESVPVDVAAPPVLLRSQGYLGLLWLENSARASCLIWPDSLDESCHRQLRVWLSTQH
jgi:hypothetical protein